MTIVFLNAFHFTFLTLNLLYSTMALQSSFFSPFLFYLSCFFEAKNSVVLLASKFKFCNNVTASDQVIQKLRI